MFMCSPRLPSFCTAEHNTYSGTSIFGGLSPTFPDLTRSLPSPCTRMTVPNHSIPASLPEKSYIKNNSDLIKKACIKKQAQGQAFQLKIKTGYWTGFWTAFKQDRMPMKVPVQLENLSEILSQVLNPVLPSCLKFLPENPCPVTCLDFELKNLSLSLFFLRQVAETGKNIHLTSNTVKEKIIGAAAVVKRVDSAFFQNSRQMRVEFLQIGVIFGVSVVKDAVEGTSLVNNVLPPAFQDRDVWLVVPTGFSKTL